jgi:hypothetical protein
MAGPGDTYSSYLRNMPGINPRITAPEEWPEQAYYFNAWAFPGREGIAELYHPNGQEPEVSRTQGHGGWLVQFLGPLVRTQVIYEPPGERFMRGIDPCDRVGMTVYGDFTLREAHITELDNGGRLLANGNISVAQAKLAIPRSPTVARTAPALPTDGYAQNVVRLTDDPAVAAQVAAWMGMGLGVPEDSIVAFSTQLLNA